MHGSSTQCRSCSSREKAARREPEERKATATKASEVALETLHERLDPYLIRYGYEYTRLRRVATSAKGRCTNPNSASYKNYGGRGVAFRFGSPSEMAKWVIDNLGMPASGQSIDRIDNDRGYEPGNLRWADRTEQSRNRRRRYKLTEHGERLRLLSEARPDLTYETIRQWVKQGLTDEEITKRKKHER